MNKVSDASSVRCGPIPVGGLTVDQPHNETMKAAYNELLDQTQCALERYYALIEQGGNE